MAGMRKRWLLVGAVGALSLLVIAGCGGGSSTAGTSTAEATASAPSQAESAVAKKREIEKKACEYEETHPASRRLSEEAKRRWAVVIPLLHKYEAEPSASLVKKITTLDPVLAHYNDITGAASIDPQAAKEMLAHEKELLGEGEC
jgi:hypothetical protein